MDGRLSPREVCGQGKIILLDFAGAVDRMRDAVLQAQSKARARTSRSLINLDQMLHESTNKTFGRYQVHELLGKGGMGEVYKALDTQLNRLVALKVIRDKYSEDESCVRRFEQEARAVSGLNHPHILTVYDIGIIEGKTFIATEFVDGHTLLKRMLDGSLDMTSLLEIAFQTAGALNAAHRAAILHRDIKPENIMLRHDGHVKLLDFGLAKLIAPSPPVAQTLPGVILGTPQYMSPEQARGSRVDTRTDIWSFGVVLYEMAYSASPTIKLHQHRNLLAVDASQASA